MHKHHDFLDLGNDDIQGVAQEDTFFDWSAIGAQAHDAQQAVEDQFHSDVLAALKTGDFGEFDAPYLNEDGTSNFNLWLATNQLHEALDANGVDPSHYESTAHDWLMGS